MKAKKNGLISDTVYNESGVIKLPVTNGEYNSYTPGKDANNACIDNIHVTDVAKGVQYIVDLTVEWSGGFKNSSTVGTFILYFQGYTSSDNFAKDASWNYSNPLTDALNNVVNLTSLVLSSTKGSKHIVALFTGTDRNGLSCGCRCNYSNGTGTFAFRNVTVIPKKYYSGSPYSVLNIMNTEITAKDYIEY